MHRQDSRNVAMYDFFRDETRVGGTIETRRVLRPRGNMVKDRKWISSGMKGKRGRVDRALGKRKSRPRARWLLVRSQKQSARSRERQGDDVTGRSAVTFARRVEGRARTRSSEIAIRV